MRARCLVVMPQVVLPQAQEQATPAVGLMQREVRQIVREIAGGEPRDREQSGADTDTLTIAPSTTLPTGIAQISGIMSLGASPGSA